MTITEVRIHKVTKEGSKCRAMATVTFDGCLAVGGLSVIEGNKGLFVSMPQTKNKDGKYYDSVIPLNKDTRASISDAVLNAYNE